VARLVQVQPSVGVGTPVQVDASTSSATAATIKNWTIAWGDGSYIRGNNQPATYSHVYPDPTPATVTLTVVDTTNQSNFTTLQVSPLAAGNVVFTASPDHASVISYEARLHQAGFAGILDSTDLGKPTPVNGIITVDLTTFFSGQPIGVYTVTIATITAGGTTDSMYSNEFSLPL